jgi:ketosteroid isomerase-like protein
VVGPAVDGRTAEKDAKGLVAEIYETIDRGSSDSMFSLLSDRLVVFGPRRTDAALTRADALVALGKVIDPKAKKHAQLHPGGVEVVTSEGGHSAWAFDLIRVDGQLLAATAVLSNTDDIWAVTAAALATMPTGKQVKAEGARDAIVPPGATAAAKVDPSAEAAVEKFKRGLVEQQAWGDDLSSRTDAIVIGPAAGEVARGKAAIKREWKARMKANVREATSGEFTAAMTADGQLVWLSVPVTRIADGEDPLPLRIFAVYEKDGPGWKMIALHEALALDEPGSGTAYKKILPAGAAPPEPAKTEPTKAELAKTDAAKADSAKADSAKAETGTTDSAKVESADKKPDDTTTAKKKKKKTRSKKKPPKKPPPTDDQ